MDARYPSEPISNRSAINFAPIVHATLGSLFYVASVVLMLRDYASVEWSMYGYRFDGINALDFINLIISCSICSIFVPKKIDNPSSLFIITSYILVVLPSFVCLTSIKYHALP